MFDADERELQAARECLHEADAIVARIQASLDAGRYVEAEAWLRVLADTIKESEDAFGGLAAGERNRVRDGWRVEVKTD